jgi:hypothetical protein
MVCGRCVYWDHIGPSHVENIDHAAAGFGRCRRHTPSLPLIGMRGEWPTTETNDWCGEFKERGDDVR